MLLAGLLVPLAGQTDPQTPESVLLQYGILGLATLVLLYVARFLFKQYQASNEREIRRADEAVAKLYEQTKYMQDTVIPTAISMVNVTQELVTTCKALIELEAEKKYGKGD